MGSTTHNADAGTTSATVTMNNGIGSCGLKASNDGNDDYYEVEAQASFTVNARPIQVTADDKSMTYGDTPPAFSVSYGQVKDGLGNLVVASGFAFSESASTLGTAGLTFGGTAASVTSSSNAGSYTIVASGLAWSNYDIRYANGTLTVDPRPITVTAEEKSKYFGEDDPDLTWQLTAGNLVGDDQITGSLTRQSGNSVGTYEIQKGSLTAGSNYDLSYIAANLTILAWNAQGYGFYQPVGVGNSVFVASNGSTVLPAATTTTVYNTAKGGSTIPLKFHVYAGSVEKTSTSDIDKFSATKLGSCSANASEDPVEFVTTGSTSLRYDGVEKQFVQNWATPKVSTDACYRATVTFADGSTLSAFFRLRR